MKQIIIVNQYAGGDELGMEFRPYQYAKYFVQQDIQCQIITSSYTHLRLQNFKQKKLIELHEKNGVYYTVIYGIKGHNYFSRLLAMIWFSLMVTYILLTSRSKYNGEIIFSSTHPFDAIPAFMLKTFSSRDFFFEVHDLWPETLIQIGKISHYNPIVFIMKICEKYLVNNARGIISLLERSDEYYSLQGYLPKAFVHIPNAFDPISENNCVENVSSKHLIDMINRLRTAKKRIVVYAGGINVSNQIEFLIDVAVRFQNQNCEFIFIGAGKDKKRLEKKVSKQKLSHIKFVGAIPKSEIQHVLKHCDVAWLCWLQCDLYQYGVSPNKLLDYMSSGLPILHICNNLETDIVSRAGCGVVTEAGSVEHAVAGLNGLLRLDDAELKSLGKSGKEFATENLNISSLATEYLCFLSEVRLKK